jgi:adenylate cyclase
MISPANNEPSLACAVLCCYFRNRLPPSRPDYSRPPQLSPAERDWFIRQGIPETAFHAPLLLNYPGPLHHYFNIYSCQDLLEMPPDAFLAFFADKLAGRIVVVGDSGYRSADIHRTPFTPGGAPPDTFGVLIQAAALRSLLDNTFITVSGIAADIGILSTVVLLAFLIAFHCSFIKATLLLLGEIVLYFAAAFFLFFQWHILVPVVVMSGAIFITGLVTILLRIAISEKDNIDAKQVLSGTIPPAIIDRCAARSEESIFLSRKAELVILACWPRHIPDISGRNTPEKVTAFLNHYYRLLREAIFANGGVFNRFAFNGVLAFWNAPLPDPEAVSHARRPPGRAAAGWP